MRHSIKAVAVLGVVVIVAACTETGVSTSSLLKPDSATLAKTPARKALLRICKLSSASNPSTADPNRSFHFRRTDGADFDLKFNGCTDPREVPTELTLTEPHDPNAPGAFSYFATRVLVTGGTIVYSSGFNSFRPAIAQDASVRLRLTAGQLATVTFFNRN